MRRKDITEAIDHINEAGALLVFPIDNQKIPDSIWYRFFPKTEMRWEWDENGDHRVSDLWHLRSALSTTGKVVYTKWYRGRATYFSKSIFTALLRSLNPQLNDSFLNQATLSPQARKILEILQSESPLSTKSLKSLADLKGRDRESSYEKALKELWSRLLIVAYGEVDDGAFPSLAIGSTQVLFENLWNDALRLTPEKALKQISSKLDQTNPFYKQLQKLLKSHPQSLKIPFERTAKKSNRAPKEIDFKDL